MSASPAHVAGDRLRPLLGAMAAGRAIVATRLLGGADLRQSLGAAARRHLDDVTGRGSSGAQHLELYARLRAAS